MANKKENAEDTATKEYKYVQRTFTVTMPDGSTKRMKVSGKTVKEAEKKRLDMQIDYAQGKLTINGNTLFGDYVKHWLTVYKSPQSGSKYYKNTKSLVQRVFTDTLGELKMCDIKASQIQKCMNVLEGQSDSKIAKSRMFIKDIFNKAVIDDIVIKNPALGINLPDGTEGERRALTEEEKTAFLAVAEKHPKGIMFSIILACGLRPQEVRALTWNDVNIKQGTVKVKEAVKAGTRDIGKPKSKAGSRTIPIPSWYIKKLQTLPLPIDKKLYIFPSKNINGLPMCETQIYRDWKSFKRLMDIELGAEVYRNKVIVSKIDPEISPYYLRHTFATHLAEMGVDIKTAQYLLGHADISTTANIYTHVTPKMLDSYREKANQIYCTNSVPITY